MNWPRSIISRAAGDLRAIVHNVELSVHQVLKLLQRTSTRCPITANTHARQVCANRYTVWSPGLFEFGDIAEIGIQSHSWNTGQIMENCEAHSRHFRFKKKLATCLTVFELHYLLASCRVDHASVDAHCAWRMYKSDHKINV